jgi:hypothetical protein
MNYFLHRYSGVLLKCLLPVILLILLTAQLSYQPGYGRSIAASGTTANLLRHPDGGVPGNAPNTPNTPNIHCHGRVFLVADSRYDLKPLFFLPAHSFCLTSPAPENLEPAGSFIPKPAAGAARPAYLRGPPSI